MKRLIECVPNFSEGCDLAKVDALVDAMSGVAGAWVLDRTSDPDHNRSVITLAGEPEAVAEAAIRGVGAAAGLIDLTRQTGAHPRIGATDVLPFIPLEGVHNRRVRGAGPARGPRNLGALPHPCLFL